MLHTIYEVVQTAGLATAVFFMVFQQRFYCMQGYVEEGASDNGVMFVVWDEEMWGIVAMAFIPPF